MPTTYESRLNSPLIAGTIIKIAKIGEQISSGNAVSEDALPAAPTSGSPGPWLTLGKVRSSTSERAMKTATVEGCNDSGFFDFQEIKLATTNKFRFSVQWITPEVFQLAFGLKDSIVDDEDQVPFDSSGKIRCWLYGQIANSGADGSILAEFEILGDLSIPTAPNWSSDPTQADFEFDVIQSSLATFTPLHLATVSA